MGECNTMTENILQKKLDPPAKILVIDDSKLNRCFIENAFIEPEYKVISASSGKEGIRLAREEKPELILMDVMMSEMDGFTATKILKSDEETRDIPIIFITALDAVSDKLRAFEVGGADFVTKPFNHKELIARVYTNIALMRSVAEQKDMIHKKLKNQKNEAIAKIAAGVAHNFNNMLGATTGNMMLLKSVLGDKLDDFSNAALADVMSSLKRMQSIVKQFLILANRNNEISDGMPQAESVNLHSAVQEALPQNSASSVHNMIPEDLYVYVDKKQIIEAFRLILIETTELTSRKAEFEIFIKRMNIEQVICSLTVKNIKIRPEHRPAIFEPFALPISNVGTGLSLPVAKQTLELNNCEITAEFSAENRVDFLITLPKVTQENEESSRPDSE